jgi:hypothetical protein
LLEKVVPFSKPPEAVGLINVVWANPWDMPKTNKNNKESIAVFRSPFFEALPVTGSAFVRKKPSFHEVFHDR